MTTGKTIVLTIRTFFGKVMSLLFSMLSRLVKIGLVLLNFSLLFVPVFFFFLVLRTLLFIYLLVLAVFKEICIDLCWWMPRGTELKIDCEQFGNVRNVIWGIK